MYLKLPGAKRTSLYYFLHRKMSTDIEKDGTRKNVEYTNFNVQLHWFLNQMRKIEMITFFVNYWNQTNK